MITQRNHLLRYWHPSWRPLRSFCVDRKTQYVKALPTVTTTPTPSTSQSTTQSQPLKIEVAPYHALCPADTSPTSAVVILHRILTPLKQSSMQNATRVLATDQSNHPVDRDPVCGFSGIIAGDRCPSCGRVEERLCVHSRRLRRITGLVGSLERWNDGKERLKTCSRVQTQRYWYAHPNQAFRES